MSQVPTAARKQTRTKRNSNGESSMMLISHAKHESNKIERNFLLEKCTWCAQEMILTEGSVILGNDWYHKECFAKTEAELNIKHGDELNC